MTLLQSTTERQTQDRVIALFRDELGYDYLGDWHTRDKNSNVEEALLKAYLTERGYDEGAVNKATFELVNRAFQPTQNLYDVNKDIYSLLKYAYKYKASASEQTIDVHYIDWTNPENNHFAIAEEVTLKGEQTRRPDLVLYINGIAIATIELKSSKVSISEGIRQTLSNQRPEYNRWFYSTIQLCFAGSDSEGLVYGTIDTPEKYYLRWKEDEGDNTRLKLDKYLLKMCDKHRLIELIRDFVLFDGQKKLPRVHQYMGIKAAQDFISRREGGIIWHTQGSGKSITMVLLAQWILANNPHARVALITDRDELDTQIEQVFTSANERIYRAKSGRDLLDKLSQPNPRLLCSLVHKFGKRDVDDVEAYIASLKTQALPVHGELFVFVDECHRTQSGTLHRLMKASMPNAVFIGFTGTPLLKKDQKSTMDVFGRYIHRYQFAEAVEDKIVLDLMYEARDVKQYLIKDKEVDEYFEEKTANLNVWQRAKLLEHWGKMQEVLSSKNRMAYIVDDICQDFIRKPRLSGPRGTAMLVASSIYDACRYYELFQSTEFKHQCAVVTSYNPQSDDMSKEDTREQAETQVAYINRIYREIDDYRLHHPHLTQGVEYEEEAKRLFREEPSKMKLLIVVDKLLTGFDAPSCTYLYIDKSMQDHGLFQAICRTNRLDGEDKTYGYIVDYKDLFSKVNDAIEVYSQELAGGAEGEVGSPITLEDKLKRLKADLEESREQLRLLCQNIAQPGGTHEQIAYFCGNTELATDLEERKSLRESLYRLVVSFLRVYRTLEGDFAEAGYTPSEIHALHADKKRYLDLRETIKHASGEALDLKTYEADMRQLLDRFVEATPSEVISSFENIPLLELITRLGVQKAIETLPASIKESEEAVAETISNNVRSKIIKSHLSDPAYFDKMSKLLDQLLADLRQQRISYREYLDEIAQLSKQVTTGKDESLPTSLNTAGLRAIYHNLGDDEALALRVDGAIKGSRPDEWRGNTARERRVQQAIFAILQDKEQTLKLFEIVKQQAEY